MKITSNGKIIRQKTLFDDENSDELYFKEEMKRLRKKEIKEKEKVYLNRKANDAQIPLSEAKGIILRSMKQYDDNIAKLFGDKDALENWFKESIIKKN